ncbi:hypothetical protein [Streptosporangium sp. CA-115845]|uniref:hypothetical protein n=1 Tax=Streptosporangium sp. CA-115845 TaxID=3240071 RepID=UPI003D930815
MLVSSKGEPFMQSGTAELASVIGARHKVIPGAHHGTPMMNPSSPIPAMESFLTAAGG